MIIQLANVGPLTYGAVRWLSLRRGGRPPPQSAVIAALLFVGCLSSLLLIFLWDVTATVGGEERSVGLFALVFFLSLVDCTSSVLFMPYMARFRQIYLNSYFIGRSLATRLLWEGGTH